MKVNLPVRDRLEAWWEGRCYYHGVLKKDYGTECSLLRCPVCDLMSANSLIPEGLALEAYKKNRSLTKVDGQFVLSDRPFFL